MYSTRTNAIEAQFSTAQGSTSLAGQQWRGWKTELRDAGRDCHKSGKNFGLIGFSFMGTECAISTFRGKEDYKTPVLAGFLVGFIGGLRAGVGPAVYGGLGFAAFSAAIELWLDRY